MFLGGIIFAFIAGILGVIYILFVKNISLIFFHIAMNCKNFFLLLGIALFFPPRPVPALERFEIISTLELENLLKQREAGTVNFILVNTLDELIYCDAHIPGSINVPLPRVDQLVYRLGTDKDKLIIPY